MSGRLSFALAALVFLATTTAQAGVPAQQRYGFNALAMPGPAVGIGVRPVLSKDLPEGDPLRVGWERFVQETGGSWRVWLDLRSGLPALVEGSGIWWFDPDGPTPDLGDLAAKARAFLAQHSGLLGSWDEQLVFDAAASATREGGGGALFFGQAVKGVPVEGAHFVFRLSRGAVVAFGAVHWAAPRRPFVAAIGVDEARNALRAHLGLSATEPLRELGTATLRILPADPEQGGARAWTGRRGEGYAHKLVWRIRIEESAGGPTWLADVDAETAAVVAFLPERMDAGSAAASSRSLRMGGAGTVRCSRCSRT